MAKLPVKPERMENDIALSTFLKKVNVTKTMLQSYIFSLSQVEQYNKFLLDKHWYTVTPCNLWGNIKRNE